MKSLLLLAVLLGMGLGSRLLYKAWLDGGDFLVYWRAVHAWVTGAASPYAVIDAAIPGFVFKYPPWILPLFTPFGFMSAVVAKTLWSVLEFGALIYSIRKLAAMCSRPWIAVVSALCWWWLWQAQFWSGQITIFMLAMAIWIAHMGKERSAPQAFVAYFFTAKIFSVVTLFGKWRELARLRTWLQIGAWIILATALVLAFYNGGPVALFQDFVNAAQSGGVSLGVGTIRGPINHGFTAMILRWLGVASQNTSYDLVLPLVLCVLLGGLWARVSSGLSHAEAWFGWLALGAVIHPLAWDHTFILAYPLGALALDRAVGTKRSDVVLLAAAGIALTALAVPNLIGTEVVKPFDFVGAKSWGVLLSAAALVIAQARAPRKPA
jgi:hypothetical protein